MAFPQPIDRASSSESFDEEDLVCALSCLEATADQLKHEEELGHLPISCRTESCGSSEAVSLAKELQVAQHPSTAHVDLESRADMSLVGSEAAEQHLCADNCRQNYEDVDLRGADSPDLHTAAALRIQRAWRHHRLLSSSREEVTAERPNPFSSPTPDQLKLRLTSVDSKASLEQSFATDDESSPVDPTYHMATVAAQLCTLASHEKHLEEITRTVPSSGDEMEGEEEEVDGAHTSVLSSAQKARLLAPSMQICFTAARQDASDVAPHLPVSGRESRGAADGASSGSPVGTDDERSDSIKQDRLAVKSHAAKMASCGSPHSRLSVDGGASDVAALAARSSSPDNIVMDSAIAAPGSQASGGRQRANQVFDVRLLSQLSVLHLQSLREEFENEVRMMSEELVEQLTERDGRVSDREEYNRLFRHYSKLQKEPTYREDSAVTWPSSFQAPNPAKPSSSSTGILSRTRDALRSKMA
eukprot:scpid8402/ scgid20329/ 